MTSDPKLEGCVATAAGPTTPVETAEQPNSDSLPKEKTTMSAMVGKEAPDFEATAYFEGGFKNIKLSDFRGKWTFLCFYPGDFTFV
jgi:peroxiredoxin (alkyl hydroperoxide reductase subunit C)